MLPTTEPPGRVHFKFTQLDRQAPDREFSLLLAVNLQEDGYFCVQKCDPLIGDVHTLVDEYNRTHEIGAFVRIIRKRFRELL